MEGGRNNWGTKLTVRLDPHTYQFDIEAQYYLFQHSVEEVSTESHSQIDKFEAQAYLLS